MVRTYWLLETRSDDVEHNPEMPMRDPPLFAHMLNKSDENVFEPVEIHVGDEGLFCFQVRVETKITKERASSWWGGYIEKDVVEEHFYVQNLGPSTIICGDKELAFQEDTKCDYIAITFGNTSLKSIKIVNAQGLCGDGKKIEGGSSKMTFRIVSDDDDDDNEGGDPKEGVNYLFYTEQLPSRPDNARVNDFHTKWYKNYEDLEEEHGFIQWLFPLFLNSGVNWEAHKLCRSEAREIRRDLKAAVNVVRSYRLMLDFYGFRLADDVTGEVVPLEDKKARKKRFENLNYSSHNYLRISK